VRTIRAVLTGAAALLLFALLPSASPPAHAATAVVINPSDRDTIADNSQLTGLRVNLPMPVDCVANKSACDAITLLNQLDGFDVDPRISLAFDHAIDVSKATVDNVYVQKASGGPKIGLNRLVWSPLRNTLYGHPTEQLEDGTTYRVVVTDGLGGAGTGSSTTITTESATATLLKMRRMLDSGEAYDAAGIAAANRKLRFTIGPSNSRTAYPAAEITQIRREKDPGPGKPLVAEMILDTNLAAVGTVAFGSFLSPSWLDGARTIPQVPTKTGTPEVTGYEEVGFTLTVPAGAKPAGGWPVAIFGPGITRSKYDLFLAADLNAARGIATMSIDPVGHNWGPRSTTKVDLANPPGTVVTFSGFGRSVDVNGDGAYTDQEGVSAPGQPHPKSAIALRDGLRQTALDNMALVRAIGRGVDVDGDSVVDLRPTNVSYYAQSLGGIYGTMVMGVDQLVPVGALNVPGGSITEIARQSPAFRVLVADSLKKTVPPLLNGGRDGFTESLPLWLDPPVTAPAVGAVPIQDAFATVDWINRSGSPETFAPLLRLRPPADSAAKKVFYQFALGDQTVPNPTSATIMRAGHLQDVTTVYRNDLTPTSSTNPHGFLLDPRISGREFGQVQVSEFLATGGTSLIDPDGPGPVMEVPVNPPSRLEVLNFTLSAATGEPPAETAAGGGTGTGNGAGADSAGSNSSRGLPATGGNARLPVLGAVALFVALVLKRRMSLSGIR
jgi:hypothetical protein